MEGGSRAQLTGALLYPAPPLIPSVLLEESFGFFNIWLKANSQMIPFSRSLFSLAVIISSLFTAVINKILSYCTGLVLDETNSPKLPCFMWENSRFFMRKTAIHYHIHFVLCCEFVGGDVGEKQGKQPGLVTHTIHLHTYRANLVSPLDRFGFDPGTFLVWGSQRHPSTPSHLISGHFRKHFHIMALIGEKQISNMYGLNLQSCTVI